jgi:hypothetical protein
MLTVVDTITFFQVASTKIYSICQASSLLFENQKNAQNIEDS